MKARLPLVVAALAAPLALAFGIATEGAALAAKIKLLSIGEVVATAPKAKGKLGLVRSTLEEELESIDWRKSTRNKPYVVSVSVVNLETETSLGKVATTCELSTTVRLAKDGNVVAILNERVRAENEATYARSVEDGAIRAAASAAIRKIPNALETVKKRGG